MKNLTMIVYAMLMALAVWFVVASIVALTRDASAFGLSSIPHTGFFMAVFMSTVLVLQYRSPLRTSLMIQVGLVGLLWLITWLTHAIENVTLAVGIAHVVVAIAFSVWNLRQITTTPAGAL